MEAKFSPWGMADISIPFYILKREGVAPWRWLCLLTKHEWEADVCRRCKAEQELVTVLELQARLNRDFDMVSGINDIK